MSMFRTAIAGLLALVGAAWGMPVQAEEHAERAAIIKEVGRLMEARDFPALEQMAEDYRSSEARTSSGVWKLTQFYDGVSNYLNSRDRGIELWKRRGALVNEWRKAYPESPTPDLVGARLLANLAWSYRGSGLADTVTAEGWRAFKEQNEKTDDFLRKRRHIAKQDPYWYELKLLLAQHQSASDEDYMAIFDEATKRHPRFYPLYFAGINNFSPKWGGNGEAVEKFARHALKNVPRKDRAALYARMYWVASQNQFGTDFFTDSLVDWPLMSQGIDDVLAQYPSEWNLQSFAYLACGALDKPKTRRLISQMTAPPDKQAWDNVAIYDKCREWALTD